MKNLIHGSVTGVAGGAGLGGALCAPLGPVAAGCALLGSFYGLAAGVFAAGLDN